MSSTRSNPVLGLSAKRAMDLKPQLPSKRKRDSICGLGSFTKSFAIRPCPESPYDKPHTFKPVRIIGRSQLPLSFLDTAADQSLAMNRLFSASIDILEQFGSEASAQAPNPPKVLIARHETKKTLYAMERVQPRVYSLCKLASWLKEKDVADLWDPENLQAYPALPKVQTEANTGTDWWKLAVVDAQPAEKPAKRAKVSMMRPKQHIEPTELHDSPTPVQESIEDLQSQAVPVAPQPNSMEPPTLPTPQEQLHNLADQYLDALYMSKTSLAYFTKGPIARIRNTFTSTEEGAPAAHELITFLRSMLLSHKMEEKKYKEKLPEVIKEFPPLSFYDEDDPADASAKPQKSKKKIKPNRDGMYPHETDVVKKWWFGAMSTSEMARDESTDQRIKRRLGHMRVREALLQMILILEITALEFLHKAPPEGQGIAADESQPVEESQAESQVKPKRKKKLDDVNVRLDLSLDKLCIWQSIDQEGVLDFDAPKEDGGVTGNDRLQSFCVEVIVPFYMHRLPEQARMVNKKLGGPAPVSPPKRKAMKPPAAVSRKSGEPKEPETKKPRRSLGRVATDTTGRTGSARAPSLSRSATDSAIFNGIKREGSEVPLSAIPYQRSPSAAARQSASQLRLLKGREMDLKTTKAEAARAAQRKRVQEDLQDAISALKKPNRGLAAGSYADEQEKRGLGALGSASRSRKPTNTVRKIVKDVQVAATPTVRRRTRDMVQQTPMHDDNPFVRPRPTDAPPSSDICIPSSGARLPEVVPGTVQRSTTTRITEPQDVAETPTKTQRRGIKKFSIPAPNGRKVFTTPSKNRMVHMPLDSPPQAIEATPTKVAVSPSPNNENNKIKNLAPTPRALFATPLKKAASAHVIESPLPNLKENLAPTPRKLFATPLKKAISAQVAESPLPVLPNQTENLAPTSPTLFATPLKKITPAQAAESPLPALPTANTNTADLDDEPNIYDALGWNDDDDFL